jgi:hypothetical protein
LRPLLVTLAVGAVVLVGVGLRAQLTDDDASPAGPVPETPRVVDADEVRGRVTAALSSMRSVSGQVTIECVLGTVSCSPPDDGRTTRQWSFVTNAAGDERITGIDSHADLAYSVARRTELVVHGTAPEVVVLTNLPAGSPDFKDESSVLRRDFAVAVRAFLDTSADVPVSEVTEGDRAAWRLAVPVVPVKSGVKESGSGWNADQMEVVVDRENGWPLRITETLAGELLDEIRLSNLVVDGAVDPASFTLEAPSGMRTFPRDARFVGVSLAEVEGVVGYRPVLPEPASLPAGYHLADVTASFDAGRPNNQGGNAPSLRVVSVAYRRGFDTIVVTTRSTGTTKLCPSGDQGCWADPVPRGAGVYDPYVLFTVGGGALAGADAQLALSPRGTPHVWTIDDTLVVTVAGDASGEELRRMIESFAPVS